MKLRRTATIILLGSVLGSHAATFEIHDSAEFSKIFAPDAVLTTNATLNSWIEGPVWVPSDGGYLVFSDIPGNKLKKLTLPSTLSDYWVPPANTKCNGNMLDQHERLISCQAGSAALQVAMWTNGVMTPLVTRFDQTKKFYSPNDLALKNDDTIWFTDPGYDSGLPGPPQPGFQPSYGVYWFHPTNGNATVTLVADDFARPNGICLSPAGDLLYVIDTGTTPHQLRRFTIATDNTVTDGGVIATGAKFDGIKCDVDGRVWAGAEDGVAIYMPDGSLIGKVVFNRRVANLCFGGPGYQTLYMVGQPIVTSIPTLTQGLPAVKRLDAETQGGQIKLTWPAPSTGFNLEETNQLSATSSWSAVSTVPTDEGGTHTVTIPATNDAAFFRLHSN